MSEKKPTYTIFKCPHCDKFIGADCFRLQDLNTKNRARLIAAEQKEQPKEAKKE